ncbi:MAG: hypothetical protein K2O18_08790 [Oscillospiraceae bacterium]|nr:hypothetical protein [Oscillospiraceae bacterium]
MNLTTTEKYALAVLETRGKLSALQREEQALCLAASCVWDMMQAGAVTADGKGKLGVSAPLPETISYCNPVYEWLAKKPIKQERASLEYISALTNKRIKTLVRSIADDLIGKSVLVVEQQGKAKLCHVDRTAITEDLEAMRDMEGAVTPDQLMLAELLLDCGTAKKLLNKQELSIMKEAVKQANGDFHVYIREVKKYFDTVNTIIWVCIGVCAATGGPVLLW